MADRKKRLFRWVGNKHHLVDRLGPVIGEHLRRTGGKLVSPFYGSGAIEQAVGLPGSRQIIADSNADLRIFWEQLALRPDSVYWALQDIDHLVGKRTAAAYRRVRSMETGPQNLALRAARFLWLQQFAWNGLWRVNEKGEHNVPPDPARLRGKLSVDPEECARLGGLVRDVTWRTDWETGLEQAIRGDLVIADPPYLDTFAGYCGGGGFSRQGHEDLAESLHAKAKIGVAIVAFNSPKAESLYTWAHVEVVKRSGRINSKGEGRGDVGELLITAGLADARTEAA